MQQYFSVLPTLPCSRPEKNPDVRLLRWRRGTRFDEGNPGLLQAEGSVSLAALFCCPLQEDKFNEISA